MTSHKSLFRSTLVSVCLAVAATACAGPQSAEVVAVNAEGADGASGEGIPASASRTHSKDAADEIPNFEAFTYSWPSHIEALGPPDLGSPSGGLGVQDDFRAAHRRVEGIVGFDKGCITLSGRFAFVNLVWDAPSVSRDPLTGLVTYRSPANASPVAPILLEEGDWILADILRVDQPSVNQNHDAASMEFVSRNKDAPCPSPHWALILNVEAHIPQEEWNPQLDEAADLDSLHAG